MIEIIRGRDKEMREWARDVIGPPTCAPDSFADDAAIGVALNGKIIAAMVYHDWYPRFGTCEISMAAVSPVWARRTVVAELLRHPFEIMGAFKVYTCTDAKNRKAIGVNLHSGFALEAVLEHQYGPGNHCVVCRMLRPDYDRLYGGIHHG